ncbi:MAG: hypothetical protein HZA08_10190 [Nitrospirae bacterium]|nr:hypothetical protein [Nitrospirota bacterium]
MKNKELYHHIKEKRDEEIRKAASDLLEKPGKDVSENLQRLDAYTKLLDAIPSPPSNEWIWALIIGILCLVVIGLLWSFRVSKTGVILKIKSEAVSLTLAKSFAADNTNLAIDRIDRLMSIDGPHLPLNVKGDNNNLYIQLNEGNAYLNNLTFGENGVLALESIRNYPSIHIYFKGSELQGQFDVSNYPALLVWEEGSAKGKSIKKKYNGIGNEPETVQFNAVGNIGVSTHFKAHSDTPLILHNLYVNGIMSFAKEVSAKPGEYLHESTISEGVLTLHDLDNKTINLNEGDLLYLEGIDGRVVEIRIGSGIDLSFVGDVKNVKIGPKDFERDIKPTYLEYMYYNYRLAFFWSAVTFLWGILWGIRKTIFM